MGIIDRMSQLIRANINDLIDRAEDPEKMIEQILRDMSEAMKTGRAALHEVVAQQKLAEADRDQANRLATEWGTKAKKAVDAGREDLAREALRRKRDQIQLAAVHEQQVQASVQASTTMRQQMRVLEARYQETLSKRDAMIARARRARAQEKVSVTLAQLPDYDPTSDLDRMDRKIREREARAAAAIEMSQESLESRFEALEDPDIEAELLALKSGSSGEDDIEAELLALHAGESEEPGA